MLRNFNTSFAWFCFTKIRNVDNLSDCNILRTHSSSCFVFNFAEQSYVSFKFAEIILRSKWQWTNLNLSRHPKPTSWLKCQWIMSCVCGYIYIYIFFFVSLMFIFWSNILKQVYGKNNNWKTRIWRMEGHLLPHLGSNDLARLHSQLSRFGPNNFYPFKDHTLHWRK